MNHKRWWSILLALVLALSACNPSVKEAPAPEPKKVEETTKVEESAKVQETAEKEKPAEAELTRTIVDSVGRKVEIPTKIERIAPSGHLAAMILYSINPDYLVGWGAMPNKMAQKYIPEKYLKLPEFGAFYGAKADLNVETLISANPQIVIDLGQVKGDEMAKQLDALQEQIGIPVVFFEAELGTMVNAYEQLGDILNEKERTKALGDYCSETLKMAAEKSASIPESERVRVYYGEGDTGLLTNPPKSIHAEVLNLVAAVNVAELSETSGAGRNEISIEQLIEWDPDVILFGPDAIYDKVAEDPLWQDIRAIQENRYYQVPTGPYNWMGRPPAVNRVLGIRWLGNLLYPQVFDYDMKEEAKKFYDLFYHYSLTDDEVSELISRSILK